MLQIIKSKIYSALLYVGSLYFKDRHSKVIYYHDIHSSQEDCYSEMSTPITLFKQHLQIIKEIGFEVVSEITAPYNQILISFDDGFRGLYQHRELLKKANIFPTIFMITSEIGRPNYLSWDELKELKNSGFNIQSHTHTHPDLNTLNKQKLQEELFTAKQVLEANLQTEITEVCFPKGLFNDSVLEVCKSIGYTKWYCSIPGNTQEYALHKELELRNLVQFSEPQDFINTLLGGMNIFKNRYSKQHYGKSIKFQNL